MRLERILIFTPTALPDVTGNAMTAERWRRSLEKRRVDVRVAATEGFTPAGMRREIDAFAPQVIHVHNAFRAGGLLLHPHVEPSWRGIPIVVSPSGTDLNIESKQEAGRGIVRSVLARADAVIIQSDQGKRRVSHVFPDCAERLTFVPKSFLWLGDENLDLKAACGFEPGCVLFLMPAGVRPVKGNLECLRGMERAWVEDRRVNVVFAGPCLDEAYGARFRSEVDRLRELARWVPSIRPAAMRSAYLSADVVLNASFSEGLSNVLIEARAAGRPLLASDIPENRWPVQGGPGEPAMGLLFDVSSPDDLARKALALAADAGLRKQLGDAGAAYASRMPGPGDEAAALLEVYKRVCSEKGTGYRGQGTG